MGGGVRLGRGGLGGQGRCERRSEVIVKIQKNGGGGGSRGVGFWGEDGCERRIEVFVKIKKKKNFFFGGGGVGSGGRVGGSG